MRIAILCLAVTIPACTLAQTAAKQVLTPDQIASTAYAAEMAREKAGDCPNADTTYAINICLSHETEITTANYKAFTDALRAILAPPQPHVAGEPEVYVGPTGPAATPAAMAAAFDKAEAAWRAYATAQCAAVDTFWRSGTIVNSMDLACSQRMTRARMHELDTAYDMPLHH